jgi:hypothetical protein
MGSKVLYLRYENHVSKHHDNHASDPWMYGNQSCVAFQVQKNKMIAVARTTNNRIYSITLFPKYIYTQTLMDLYNE